MDGTQTCSTIPPAHDVSAWRWQTWFDVQLVGAVCGTALLLGGRDDVGRLVFVACVLLLALTLLLSRIWQGHRQWYWTGAEKLLLAGVLLLIIQLAPLPQPLLDNISPTLRASLPQWRASADSLFGLGQWCTVSLVPHATQQSLTVFLAYAVLFLAVAQRIQRLSDAEHVLRLLGICGAVVALVAWLQWFSGTERYVWLIEHAHRSPQGQLTGGFTNRNHFAHFLLLASVGLFYEVVRCRRPGELSWKNLAFWILLLITLFAILVSFSRGALVALVVVVIVAQVITAACGRPMARLWGWGAAATAVLLVALSLHGWHRLLERITALAIATPDGSSAAARWELWKADARAAADFWLLGSGAGTHAAVYPRYLQEQFDVRFTHAENSYLQVVLETGLAGLGLLICGVWMILGWCVRLVRSASNPVTVGLAACVCGGVAAGLVHNLVDFPWYVPACMAGYLIILAVVCRSGQLLQWDGCESECEGREWIRPPHWVEMPRAVWYAQVAAVFAVALATLPDAVRSAYACSSWNAYLKRSASTANLILQDSEEARMAVSELLDLLNQTVRVQPAHELAWMRMAALEMRLFDLLQRDSDNALNTAQLRSAVYEAGFNAAQPARQWLDKAIGANLTHLRRAAAAALRAARLSPWSGEAYLYLAEVAFVHDPNPQIRSDFLEQASLVRPHDGAVLFARGVEFFQQGRVQEAVALWQQVYHSHASLRERLTMHLVGQIPVEVFVQLFAPDARDLWVWLETCRRQGRSSDAREAAVWYIGQVQSQQQRPGQTLTAESWYNLADAYLLLGDKERSVEALAAAVDARPDALAWRTLLAQRLADQGRWQEAIDHVRYCLQRRPYDEQLQQQLAQWERQKRVAQRVTAPISTPEQQSASQRKGTLE